MKTFHLHSFIGLIFSIITVYSCAQKPKPIEYNSAECALCKMRVVDPKFGAELVTSTGKIFTFDSAECMLRYLKKNSDTEFAHILVTDYNQPENLIDATKATFLISEDLPSPMGADLSAYGNLKEATLKKEKLGGELYDFNKVKEEL